MHGRNWPITSSSIRATSTHTVSVGKTNPASKGRRLITCEQLRGPLAVPSLGISMPFEQLYAKTGVPRVLH
jgi:hypothetical protein